MGEYKNVPQEINDVVSDNIKKLAQLFPSAVKDGQLDVNALKEELGTFEEVGKEKYEFTWSGKQNAKKIAQQDVFGKTLKFCPEKSKNADTTENIYIEGDNLEALKLLRQNYYNSIKMIYIDPPYNTGNDFVYNDDYSMSQEESDIAEGVVDELGERYTKNISGNKFHANWCNMIYPRLKVAKDLLTDDGVIFISIDDNEVENLIKVGKEIFGEENYINALKWKRKKQPSFLSKHIAPLMEYVLIFAKNSDRLQKLSIETVSDSTKKVINISNQYSVRKFKAGIQVKSMTDGIISKGKYIIKSMSVEYLDDVIVNNGRSANDVNVKAKFLNTQDKIDEYIEQDLLFITSNNGLRRLVNTEEKEKAKSITDLLLDWGDNQDSEKEQKEILDNKFFDYTKPILLLHNLIKSCTSENEIVLDFFSGSATTAHAVMQLNAEDGGNRKFIMVQLEEKTDEKSEAYKAGYNTICEIGEERIRRAGDKIKAEHPDADIDIGFKVFEIADTNIKWNELELKDEQIDFDSLSDTPDQIDFKQGTKDIDVVYEIMLRQKNIPLSSKIEVLDEIGSRTYLYADSYLISLETQVTNDMIDKLASLDPTPFKYIFRDSAFKDDIDLKTNAFRRLKAMVEKHAGATKKAYTVEFI